MLQTQNLAARRGEALLFSDVSFHLAAGTALVIGGPNGSGKTTLLRILAGLTEPAEGSLTWRGAAMRPLDWRMRAETLFIGHVPALKDELSALENLASLASLHGGEVKAEGLREALAAWSLSRQRSLPARVLSQGQRRRIGLARLGLVPRALWLLDEPATALDDAGIAALCAAVAAHLAEGGIAVIATHQELALPAAASRSLRLT
ncbi:MAG TPA: cytochrome c biogenesis heme-transporting ATPase CcmA [Casimicrobiaceae bacterium]|jgi:heme exporter protein A|nr:cytochrome c biogenesis heme-transporting ATPase CcmA [Casimicrobiaceae bacterium]